MTRLPAFIVRHFYRLIFVFFPLVLNCAFIPNRTLQIDAGPVKLYNDLNAPDVRFRPALRNPRDLEILLQWQISNIRLFSPEELRATNDSLTIPAEQTPCLLIWTSEPIDRAAQTQVQYRTLKPSHSDIYEDRLNGNRLRFWDFSESLKDGQKLQIIRKMSLTCYEIDFDIDSSKVGLYDQKSRFWNFYTRSEPWLMITAALKDTAEKIVGGRKNPYLSAREIFRWVRAHGAYDYPPKERGALQMLETMSGDCGQFSYLFIALCRAIGIPARLVAGFRLNEDQKLAYHAWAECFMPDYGWVPADLTAPQSEFGKLDNRRAVSSVGMNIILPNLPAWATYKNSSAENGVTDFIQLATIVKSGFAGVIESEVKVLKSKLR